MQISFPIDLYLNLETLFICVVCSSSAHRRKPQRKVKPQLPSPLLLLLTRRRKPQTQDSLWTPDGCEGKKKLVCISLCMFMCALNASLHSTENLPRSGRCSPSHSLKHSAEGKVSPSEEAKSWLDRTLLEETTADPQTGSWGAREPVNMVQSVLQKVKNSVVHLVHVKRGLFMCITSCQPCVLLGLEGVKCWPACLLGSTC